MAIHTGPVEVLDISRLAAVIDRLRAAHVRVHCITSPVAAERTANTLLALGARPSMTIDSQEIQAFVQGSDALLINLGMMDAERRAAIPLAVEAANATAKPWVLDPVFTNVSHIRATLALDLLAARPAVLKANRAEAGLIDAAPDGTVRIITGAVDVIALAGRTAEVPHGSPLAAQVTAMGCALGAVVAACLAVEADRFTAAAAAMLAYGLAVQNAARTASGPGSFGYAIYDALAALDAETILKNAV